MRTALKTGAGYITGLMLQWQDGKQVNLWPTDLANGKLNSRPSSRSALALTRVTHRGLTSAAGASDASPHDGSAGRPMLFWQILIDGFAISSLYALGATGFTLIFGVSGVLNLSHGAIMVAAAVAAWAAAGDFGTGHLSSAPSSASLVGLVLALATYFVDRCGRSSARARSGEEEKEIFILTGTLLWGIMIQELIAYLLHQQRQDRAARSSRASCTILGVRTPTNEIFTAVICWAAIGAALAPRNRTRTGKAVLAASMNPRGVTLLGIELSRIYFVVWAIYGVLAGIAGVLLGMFLGVSSYSAGPLTASAFSIVVLGGLGSVSGSLIAAYVVGYLETMTAYLISPAYRSIPALLLLVVVMYVRPRGLLGRR